MPYIHHCCCLPLQANGGALVALHAAVATNLADDPTFKLLGEFGSCKKVLDAQIVQDKLTSGQMAMLRCLIEGKLRESVHGAVGGTTDVGVGCMHCHRDQYHNGLWGLNAETARKDICLNFLGPVTTTPSHGALKVARVFGQDFFVIAPNQVVEFVPAWLVTEVVGKDDAPTMLWHSKDVTFNFWYKPFSCPKQKVEVTVQLHCLVLDTPFVDQARLWQTRADSDNIVTVKGKGKGKRPASGTGKGTSSGKGGGNSKPSVAKTSKHLFK